MSIGAQGEIEFIGDKLFCLRFFMLLNKAQMAVKRHFAEKLFFRRNHHAWTPNFK